jgi:hypothetical protein
MATGIMSVMPVLASSLASVVHLAYVLQQPQQTGI